MTLRIPLFAAAVLTVAAFVSAQPPAEKGKNSPTPSLVDYILSFGKKQPGQVAKDELTDRRLHTVFDLADANKDGIVTREEITAYAARLTAEEGAAGKGKAKGPKGM